MSAKTKITLIAVAALVLGILLLPRLARRIDATLDPIWEKAATTEAQYQDMTNAYPIAAEVVSDHPTHRLWQERRKALFEAGYIETREFRMRHSLTAKGAVSKFFNAFQSRFPGVECSVRGAKSNEPMVVVTARKFDFGPIGAVERFVTRYDPGH
jgi:hypothetical protein